MLLLVIDWDETITAKDTLRLIAPSSPSTRSTSLPTSPRFSTLSKFYMQDLSSHRPDHLDALPPRNLGDQLRYLDSLDQVELKSQQRVEQSGLFRDFHPDLLKKSVDSQQLVFRNGWAFPSDGDGQGQGQGQGDETKRKISSASSWIQEKSKINQVEFHILSVGWSARFIRLGLTSEKGGSFPSDVPRSIIANEIQIGKDGRGTGIMTKSNDTEFDRFERIDLSHSEDSEGKQTGESRAVNNHNRKTDRDPASSTVKFSGIRTGIHKLRELKRLRQEKSKQDEKGEGLTTVYVGDSDTDLPCLLASDVGIIMGESGSLVQTLQRLNLDTFLSVGFEEWKIKRSRKKDFDSFSSNDSGLNSSDQDPEIEVKEGEEIWKEILVKEKKSRENHQVGFDLVQVKDWSEGLEVLQVLAGES